MSKNITILQHNISYYYDNEQDMPEHEQEHVKEMIIDGYNQGELNEEHSRGWWHIV